LKIDDELAPLRSAAWLPSPWADVAGTSKRNVVAIRAHWQVDRAEVKGRTKTKPNK